MARVLAVANVASASGRLAQAAHELGGLLAAVAVGLLARRIGDLAPVVAHLFGREAAFAQVHALGLVDAGERKDAGAGGEDGPGRSLLRAEVDDARRHVV